jgi:hypothetical protein
VLAWAVVGTAASAAVAANAAAAIFIFASRLIVTPHRGAVTAYVAVRAVNPDNVEVTTTTKPFVDAPELPERSSKVGLAPFRTLTG